MKKTMTKRGLLDFNKTLNQLLDAKGVIFAHALTLNQEAIKPELKAIQKAGEESKEHKEFDNERVELCIEYSKKDDKGGPLVFNNNYVIADHIIFDKKLEKLRKKHKVVIEERKKQLNDVTKLLDKEIKVEIKQLKLEDFPNDVTPRQMRILKIMVKS